MVKDCENLNDLVSLCKRRGFVFPSSEVYGGLNSCWDYGPLGVILKQNIKDKWWRSMTWRKDIEGLDASILMHPHVWKASGHVDGFTDPLVDCKKCKARYRADQMDEAVLQSRICPQCKGALTEPRQFNLMFKTQLGALEDESAIVYLRPETAQGIYVNFLNVQQSSRQKVPFGIAQIGKAFRNEITPGNFIFRTREFEQMEMQYFVKPGTDGDFFDSWLEKRLEWHQSNGLRKERLRVKPHDAHELAHYAKAAVDIEYCFPFGWKELEGVHNRTDFDLKRHQEWSGKRLEYFDALTNEHYIPFIIETSAGCDRTLLTILVDSYRSDAERVWLSLKPSLAPVQLAVFPLMKKPDLMQLADQVETDLREHFRTDRDDQGSIGKRYRRQDEIGTPYGITVDYETLTDHAVTVRHRDTMQQERIPLSGLKKYFMENMQ